MFRVTSKGRYGVKAVYELARHYGEGPLTVGMIAQAQWIPEQYLEQLMPLLKRAGIVRGMRGAQGGYVLAVPPHDISVRDVVRAVEGPILVADCAGDARPECEASDRCIGPDVWTRVQEAVEETMAQMTFAALLESPRPSLRWATWMASERITAEQGG